MRVKAVGPGVCPTCIYLVGSSMPGFISLNGAADSGPDGSSSIHVLKHSRWEVSPPQHHRHHSALHPSCKSKGVDFFLNSRPLSDSFASLFVHISSLSSMRSTSLSLFPYSARFLSPSLSRSLPLNLCLSLSLLPSLSLGLSLSPSSFHTPSI